MSQSDVQIEHDSMDLDPQSLFSQFSPTLFFDQPVCTKDDWYILAEQTVPVTIDAFWKTIERWTAEPELVIPPVEKAEIISTTEAIDNKIKVILRELIPKRKSKDTNLMEEISYYENEREATVVYKPMIDTSSLPFYYPKVSRILMDRKYGNNHYLEAIPDNPSQPSMSSKQQYAMKIPKEVYQSMYLHLKSKYGPYLVEKFVYEDIAIASYLLCLWKEEEIRLKRRPTFADLGCGNGLLTFLLVREGYEGYGVDIAERKIWTMLCKSKKDMLRVEVLHPSQEKYPNVDWLIGNHADELVPWIPIIASKSGDNCNFMVIPCCFYGLDGTKALTLKMVESEGKYRAYTNYIKNIAEKSGFICEEDYLRIPSTKNIAIIGRNRSNRADESFIHEAESITQSQILNNISQVIDHIATDKTLPSNSNPPAPSPVNSPSAAPQIPSPQSSSPPSPPTLPASEQPKNPTTVAPVPTEATPKSPSAPQPTKNDPPPNEPTATTQPKKPSDNTPTEPPKPSEKKPDRSASSNNKPDESATQTSAPKSPNGMKAPESSNKAISTNSSGDDADDKNPAMSKTNNPLQSTSGVPGSAKTVNNNDDNGGSKTGTIAGAVIGSLIGLALLSGLLTWINRHKGCASKRKAKPEFEDYGLADTDFPQHRSPAMANTPNAISPTTPYLNDQGNYYSKEELNSGYMPSYPVVETNQHLNNYPQPDYYYNNNNPQLAHEMNGGGGYYDENGYYYENTTHQTSGEHYTNQQPSYPYPEQYHHNVNYYKPDQIADGAHHPYS
ncbi:hypothetical protein G6F60_006700 [Rhizopus arrhizus]|nr:hypothetical protein G6F61_006306 [Rhizopus arrhizus]KAG1400960.1 hypothetical protein G6F60_006700 [Rhizopus arrhizus]